MFNQVLLEAACEAEAVKWEARIMNTKVGWRDTNIRK